MASWQGSQLAQLQKAAVTVCCCMQIVPAGVAQPSNANSKSHIIFHFDSNFKTWYDRWGFLHFKIVISVSGLLCDYKTSHSTLKNDCTAAYCSLWGFPFLEPALLLVLSWCNTPVLLLPILRGADFLMEKSFLKEAAISSQPLLSCSPPLEDALEKPVSNVSCLEITSGHKLAVSPWMLAW